ncbi:hypothetical protein NKR23_g3343 [Pleurostoma richardsiae]|uniref:Cupin type-2 domain-containing protein n=1 Tax=Pleurostoma richardsiae TaxID=41990 RepID=A0AA38S522_9PEZI|nr:hypothetical protein NKR23_g3343 [Pleurostoma richardsiae]
MEQPQPSSYSVPPTSRPPPPPPPRLLRTAHTLAGTSVVASDGPANTFSPFGPAGTAFSVLDAHPAVPVSNANQTPSSSPPPPQLPRCPPAGVMFTVSDIPPGQNAPMHRTLSLDYAVVLSGEIVLVLDGGEERTMVFGDTLVQGGVNHSWVNRGREWCRILFVMVGAEKVVLEDGTALEETVFKR